MEACSKVESSPELTYQRTECDLPIDGSLPSAQMGMSWASRRLSVHQIRLLRTQLADRKVETASCPEMGDVPLIDLPDPESCGKNVNDSFFPDLKNCSLHM